MYVGEDLHKRFGREVLVDGCSIVVYGAKGTDVGLVFGDRIASCRAVVLAKETVMISMLGDP